MSKVGQTLDGYLVLADISGYTAFVTATELEHAQGIIAELIAVIRGRLAPPLTFVKVEGDCVLCYAESARFADAERLCELLEVCYFDFATHLSDMARATTCPCAACTKMGDLDLKFVAHHGAFMIQSFGGVDDVAGRDVILAHRLLKNAITERTGVRAYVFFTDPCRARLPVSMALLPHAERYESLGEAAGGVYDLAQSLAEMREAQREYVSPAEADFVMAADYGVPPAVVWQYAVDPQQRLRWELDETGIQNSPNERGRLGTGATSHCSHGHGSDLLRRYVDWQPFRYFTWTVTAMKPSLLSVPSFVETFEITPTHRGGSHSEYRMRLRDRRVLQRLRFRVMAPVVRTLFGRAQRRLTQIIDADSADFQELGQREQ